MSTPFKHIHHMRCPHRVREDLIVERSALRQSSQEEQLDVSTMLRKPLDGEARGPQQERVTGCRTLLFISYLTDYIYIYIFQSELLSGSKDARQVLAEEEVAIPLQHLDIQALRSITEFSWALFAQLGTCVACFRCYTQPGKGLKGARDAPNHGR